MLLAAAALLIAGAVLFTIGVREKDLPDLAPVSPAQHLEERKTQIYDNLRDLQFEFRVGKLSEADYQKTKVELQGELAKVMAAIDHVHGKHIDAKAAAPPPAVPQNVCPHCKAKFDRALKFCGECGKPMAEGATA
jgi:hypothetical protein